MLQGLPDAAPRQDIEPPGEARHRHPYFVVALVPDSVDSSNYGDSGVL